MHGISPRALVLGSFAPESVPVVACYCHDFLKSDMQHVFRQVTSLREWTPAVICQKRENAEQFPFPSRRISVLPKPRGRWLRRQWFRHVRKMPFQISTSRVIELLTEVGRHEADVVHVFFGHIAVQLLPFIQACRRPVVVSFHGADVGVDVANPKFHAILEGVFRAARLVLARSESLLEGLASLGCPAEKLRLQRTGIPLDAWAFQPRSWPADGAWRLLQACRLVPKKGLRTTLMAFREISRVHPLATLTLAGDGPLREELQRTAEEWGLADRVVFPGFLQQETLRALNYESHLFFHPSETPADGNREGVPNAMLEAMASGLPVVATRHGGIPEAIADGESGRLVAEGDAPALAAAALDLMASEVVYRKMASGGRVAVEEKFERTRQTALLESFYAEALHRRTN